jgi:hypothetical protein
MNKSIEVIEQKIIKGLDSIPNNPNITEFRNVFKNIKKTLNNYNSSSNILWLTK